MLCWSKALKSTLSLMLAVVSEAKTFGDSKPLYIGMSKSGLQRCSQRAHEKAALARAECDEVLIYPCISASNAYKLETLLISCLQPVYNIRQRTSLIASKLGVKVSHFNHVHHLQETRLAL